jgi:hypothetical protein
MSKVGAIRQAVIAGLDPAIHRAKRISDVWMDARVKPAHDDTAMR